MKFIPYLLFEGNAEEALAFYEKTLGGKINGIMRYSEDEKTPAPEGYENKILHSELDIDGAILYLSDGAKGEVVGRGDQVSISIAFDSLEAIDRVYNLMKVEGKVYMPLEDTFWGAKFASLVDKYGVSWSMNYQYPRT